MSEQDPLKVRYPLNRRFLEVSPYDGDLGAEIGRDPRKIPTEDWRGVSRVVGFKAIRAKCLDCCCGSASEVRKCACTKCPLWPLGMGSNPKGLEAAAAERTSEYTASEEAGDD